jgi:hypothetical protein
MAEQHASFCGPPATQVPAVQVVGGAVGQLLAQVVVVLPASQLPGVPPVAGADPPVAEPPVAVPPEAFPPVAVPPL